MGVNKTLAEFVCRPFIYSKEEFESKDILIHSMEIQMCTKEIAAIMQPNRILRIKLYNNTLRSRLFSRIL